MKLMPTTSRTLHHAVGSPEQLQRLIADGVPLEAHDDQGCTALFIAVIQADIVCIGILLEAGANPNVRAEEPAATIYAATALSLAQQARYLMSHEQYAPVIELLRRYGAVDEDPKQE